MAIAALFSFAIVACGGPKTTEDEMDTEPAEEQVDEMDEVEVVEPEVEEEEVAEVTEDVVE